MTDIAVSVLGLGKQYRLGGGAHYHTLREAVTHLARTPWRWLGRARHGSARNDADNTIWALRDVSFEVRRGEVVGIIGRNGAGKSTLLKILSQITEPTTGEVQLTGRVGSLLEVGTGFHPELTGRENIFLNGAILGMKRSEIVRKFDEIVAFAEVERFIDTPVKHYSSGMYMRLAFAVAAHLEPEILVVDEVLAVGDVAFQKKCLGKMGEVAKHGRTVLFVSHNLQAVTTLCEKAILLSAGQLEGCGGAHEIANRYLQSIEQSSASTLWQGDAGDDTLRLTLARVVGEGNQGLPTHKEFKIQLFAEILKPLTGLIFAIEVYSGKQQLLAYTAHDDALPPPPEEIKPGPFAWELVIPANTFAAGTYEFRVDIGIHNANRIVQEPISFLVTMENFQGIGRRYYAWTHCFRPNWEWRRIALPDDVLPPPTSNHSLAAATSL